MASRAELEAQAAAQGTVVAAAWAQLQAGWAQLGLTADTVLSPSAIAAIKELLGDIVSAWGEVAGTLAADFYDDLREQAEIPGGFTAYVPDPFNPGRVSGIVDWAATPPVGQELDVDAMLAKLEGPAQRLLRQAQRDALEESARRDPARPRVARVPMGAETCAFCLVMASRGYVYRTVDSAGGGSPENRFHDLCDCEQDVTWSTDPVLPEGYDPGELYGRYEAARAAAGTADLRRILRELRLLEGIR